MNESLHLYATFLCLDAQSASWVIVSLLQQQDETNSTEDGKQPWILTDGGSGGVLSCLEGFLGVFAISIYSNGREREKQKIRKTPLPVPL